MVSNSRLVGSHAFGSINIKKFKEDKSKKIRVFKSSATTENSVTETPIVVDLDADLSVSLDKMNIAPPLILLINVSFSYPYNWTKCHKTKITLQPVWQNSMQMYDGQTLADVRRTFVCEFRNNKINGIVDQNVQKILKNLEINDLIHSVFYINDIMYVDCQPEEITEEHTVILEKWALDRGFTFDKVLSQETQFVDMEIYFGQAFVFQHSGDCEHMIVFNDIRLAHLQNTLDRYPKILELHKEGSVLMI